MNTTELVIAEEAVGHILSPITDDEDVVYGGTPIDDRWLDEVLLLGEQTGDMPFAQLAMESVLLGAGSDDEDRPTVSAWEAVAPQFGMNAEEVVRDLYGLLFGALPEGPPPRLRLYSALSAPRDGTGVLYRHEYWVEVRNKLYGLPPYDVEALRASAIPDQT